MVFSRRRPSAAQRYLQRAQTERPSGGAEPRSPLYGLPTMQALAPATRDDGALVPDLLHPTASRSLDHRAARRTLEFAFTAGDSAGLASGALTTAAMAESQWEPASFADELFVDALIEGVLTFAVEGKRAPLHKAHLRRLLTQPPRDLSITEFRQRVLEELTEKPALLEATRSVYARIANVLRLLDEGESDVRYGLPRWRLELLGAVRALFVALDGPFEGARSALHRLHDFAQRVHESEGYRELCALLDFEGDMARVDLRVRIGVDGRVRELTTLAVREQPTSPFYRGPLGRLLSRILHALRGYQLGEAMLVERWFDYVFGGMVEFLPAVLQLRGDLEFYLAAFQLRGLAETRGLEVSVPVLCTGEEATALKQLRGLFNPLLLLHGRSPVPCDLALDTFSRSCILTGPNSGGKTRLLQALSLTQMLGQAGFFVPAAHVLLRPASGMFVSLAQPSSAEAEEGRLGTELLRIRRLFEAARPGCLIVLDELCSGTNPSEGEEIFHLVVGLLRELEPEVYITTHFLQMAAHLATQAEELCLCFLQVELNEDRAPTFQFVPGVATTSLAHQTAKRLGVSREELLALIRRRR